MKKYLCILDFPSGIAELANAGIVEAEDDKKAKCKFLSVINLANSALMAIRVFPLEELHDGWTYYS